MVLRDHPAGERGPERETLTRASRGARTRASVLDSQISHLRREPGRFWRGDSHVWEGISQQDPLAGDVGTIPQVAVNGPDKPGSWAAPRWAHHQGLVAAACPSGVRGAGPGAGPCLHQKMRLPGRPGCQPVGRWAGGASGWKQLGWKSGPWRLATGGSAP